MTSFCILSEMCSAYDPNIRRSGFSYGYNLCVRCFAQCTGEVYALVLDYIDLSQIIARQQGHSDSKIARPKPQSTPPIDLRVNTLRSEISAALTSSEVVIRFELRLSQRPRHRVREGHNVQQAAALVADHVELFAAMELPAWFLVDDDGTPPYFGADALLMLRRLHQQARRLLGATELVISLPGYCEGCHGATLRRRSGSETVHCAACDMVQPWDVYRRRVSLIVGGDNAPRQDSDNV